jgi:hypothetical protein
MKLYSNVLFKNNEPVILMHVVKEYSGQGLFHFTSNEMNFDITDLNFLIKQYSDSKIEIYCHPPIQAIPHIINFMQDLTVSIDANIESEGHLNIQEALISTFNMDAEDHMLSFKLRLRVFEPVEIIFENNESSNIKMSAGLTNFIFNNCENQDEYGILANLENFSIYLKHHENYREYSKLLNDRKETKLVTAEVIIDSKGNSLNFREISDNLTYLLSFASGTLISPIYEDYYFEEKIFKTILRPIFTEEFKKDYQLITGSGCNIKNYLEDCFSNYSLTMHNYGLNIVINFYLSGINHDYVDIGFLLLVTSLETILAGYAETREIEKNPIQKQLYERNRKNTLKILNDFSIHESEKIADLIVEKVSYSHLTIPDKLNAFIKDERHKIELDRLDNDFINIRNKIAHTGKTPKKIKYNGSERDISIAEEFNRLNHLLDRIILTVLDYKHKPFINRMNNEIIQLD